MFDANKGISLIITALSVIVFIIIGFFTYQQFFSNAGAEGNINFSRAGNLLINNPGLEENTWYLLYENPGSPANSVKLSFNDKSVCKNQDNSCLDLVAGDRASIKGIETNGKVLVRELEILGGSEIDIVNGPIVVDWEAAMGFLNDCRVNEVSSNNEKEVYLTLDDGRKLFTVESKDDSISKKIKEIEKRCGKITFVSE
ncbi:MAG: hypothetical protein WC998_01695 [Candidatus Paceibacterota bacterium]|jgi:hypothetical protein